MARNPSFAVVQYRISAILTRPLNQALPYIYVARKKKQSDTLRFYPVKMFNVSTDFTAFFFLENMLIERIYLYSYLFSWATRLDRRPWKEMSEVETLCEDVCF